MQLILHKMLKTYTILVSPVIKRMHINSFYPFLFQYRSISPEETAEVHIEIASYDQKRSLNLEKSQHSVAFIHKHLISSPNPPHNLTQRHLSTAFISPMSARSPRFRRPRRLRRVHFPQLFGIFSPLFPESLVFSEIYPPFSQLPPHDNEMISSSPPKTDESCTPKRARLAAKREQRRPPQPNEKFDCGGKAKAPSSPQPKKTERTSCAKRMRMNMARG